MCARIDRELCESFPIGVGVRIGYLCRHDCLMFLWIYV